MTTPVHRQDGARTRGGARRRRLERVVLLLALAATCVLGAAYTYALTQRDTIARGIHVGTIAIGGLSTASARSRLEHAFRPLRRPLVLRSSRGRLVLTAQSLKLAIGTDAVVDRAVALSDRGWFVTRTWRQLRGGHVDENLEPHVRYSDAAVTRAIHELQKRIDRPARNATLVPSFDRVRVTEARRGVAVAAARLRREIAHVLSSRTAPRLLAVPILHPGPHVTAAVLRRQYPSFITIDRGRFTLRVYSHLRLVRSYPIAVGQAGLQTPAGIYHIQNKVVNPSWQVPFSSWTGSLAGKLIPPGPDDPLKARWLGIFNGAGIHGTDETWSIGHAVSHGCVRMTIPDVIDLYDRVSVGTPVYIGD
jgi:L,D-transpeptidase catalytic domain/Putative peptidoglycan binding domain